MIIISYRHISEKTFKTERKRHSLLIILTISAISETIFEHMISMFQEMGNVLLKILLSSSAQTNIMNGLKQKRTRNWNLIRHFILIGIQLPTSIEFLRSKISLSLVHPIPLCNDLVMVRPIIRHFLNPFPDQIHIDKTIYLHLRILHPWILLLLSSRI
jgi:hypothetical protein